MAVSGALSANVQGELVMLKDVRDSVGYICIGQVITPAIVQQDTKRYHLIVNC